jgi:hypothetical protein
MADHAIKQVLDAVVIACTGLATTGARVKLGRMYVSSDAEVPGLDIDEGGESVETGLDVPALQERQVSIRINVKVKQRDTYVATLLQCRKEVEVALSTFINVGSKLVLINYLGADDYQVDGDGEIPIITQSLNFTAQIATFANAPDVLAQ